MSIKKKEKKETYVSSTAIAGILAGVIPKFLCHPIDTIKAKLQVNRERMNKEKISSGFKNMWRTVYRSEGLRGFYPGAGISIIGSAPATSLYFTTYEHTKRFLQKKKYFGDSEYQIFLAAGMTAEAVSCLIWLPIDVIKERLQVQSTTKLFSYKNSFDAIKQILANEGVRGIYRAYGATLLSFGPTSALYFTFYEKLKSHFIKDPNNIAFHESLTLSLVAGSTAAYITTPLDIAKLRMQVQRGQLAKAETGFGYKNMFHGIYLIVKEEGVLSLYKGGLTRVYYSGPMTAFAMSILETSRIFLEGSPSY